MSSQRAREGLGVKPWEGAGAQALGEGWGRTLRQQDPRCSLKGPPSQPAGGAGKIRKRGERKACVSSAAVAGTCSELVGIHFQVNCRPTRNARPVLINADRVVSG